MSIMVTGTKALRVHYSEGTWDSAPLPDEQAAERFAFFLVNNGLRDGNKVYPASAIVCIEILTLEEPKLVIE